MAAVRRGLALLPAGSGRHAPVVRKARVDAAHLLGFVRENFAADAAALVAIAGGETSQAYSIASAKREFVLRVLPAHRHRSLRAFNKDRLAAERYASKAVPIPRSLQSGRLGEDLVFSITEKVPGHTLAQLGKDAIRGLLPAIVEAVDAIHAIDVGDTRFGDWSGEGVASAASWQEFLRIRSKEFDRRGRREHGVLVEARAIERFRGCYAELIASCPNERHLLHGDLSSGNLLADGSRISGVIDWAQAKYGDFLFDVARLDFWDADIGYAACFRRHYAESGRSVARFEERLLCYQLYTGLGALRFHSIAGNSGRVDWTIARLNGLIAQR